MTVKNNTENLRRLLTDVYVAVTPYIATDSGSAAAISDKAWDSLATTLLNAGEGRPFEHLKMPWPPEDEDA